MTPPPAPSPSTSEADQLLQLMSQQRDLYRSLHELSSQQQTVIAEGRTEDLLTLLSQRQRLVDQLTSINRQIAPLRDRMSEIAAAAPEALRQQLRSLVDEVQAMLQSIIDHDEQDRKALEASKAQVGKELAKVRTAPAAVNAYRASAGPGIPMSRHASSGVARFTDSRG